MEEKCKTCENQQACVPFFMHENSMMHKDADNERLTNIAKGQRTINVIQSIIILLIVFIMAMLARRILGKWETLCVLAF